MKREYWATTKSWIWLQKIQKKKEVKVTQKELSCKQRYNLGEKIIESKVTCSQELATMILLILICDRICEKGSYSLS